MANSYDVVPVREATIFEHVRPTVVVRRRTVVIDAPVATAHTAETATPSLDPAVDEEMPPSSIFVHPDYNIVEDDPPSSIFFGPDSHVDEADVAPTAPIEVAAEPAEAKPARLQVEVPSDATVGDVAKRLGVPAAHATAELVARGLFSTTAKTTVSSEILNALGEAYDRDLIATPAPVKAAPSAAAKKKARPAGARSRARRRA